jgi:hypothetical protein
MKNENLKLRHTLEELHISPTAEFNHANLPEIYSVAGTTITPYMPRISFHLGPVGEPRLVEMLPDGKGRFAVELNWYIPEVYQVLFEDHRNNRDVTFDGNTMLLCCDPESLQVIYDEICYHAIPATINDYVREHGILAWQLYMRKEKQDFCDRVENGAMSDLEKFKAVLHGWIDYARTNDFSVPFFTEHYTRRYRETLDTKFKVWGNVLDEKAIQRLRTVFELELLQA